MARDWYFASCNKDYKSIARKTVLAHLIRSKDLNKMITLDMNGAIVMNAENLPLWKGPGLHEYTASDIQFREWLCLAMVFLGGMAGRGTETLSQLYKNKQSGKRNLFVSATQGQAYSITRYHKSQAITESLKPIARFYPWDLTKLILTYFSIVVPFHEWACPEFLREGFIFPDGRGGHWTTDKQTDLLERESKIHLGTVINTQLYRHFQAEFDRRFVRSGFEHKYEDDDDSDGEDDNPFDMQAAHSSKLSNRWYGVGPERMDLPSFNKFNLVSNAYHRSVKFLSSPDRSIFMRARESRAIEESEATDSAQNEVELCLHQIYPDGEWKSVAQRDAIMKIVNGSRRLMCILPTGGGKSLLIVLPAMLAAKEGKSTIVFVPYRSLAQDLKSYCEGIRLSCLQWTGQTNQRASVVIVVTDTGTLDEFAQYVNDLYIRGELKYVFMDECHWIQTERHFRYKFERFKYMNIPVPMIFLTATHPPSCEEGFKLDYNLVNPPLEYIRVSTNRTKACYSVKSAPSGKLQEYALKSIDAEAQSLQGQKVMVFVTNRQDLEVWQHKMTCSIYAAGREDNEEQLQKFNDGVNQIIVTTSALGAGMNFEQVGAVYILGETFGTEEFVQQTGRGGREGHIFKATTIIDERTLQRMRQENPNHLRPSKRALREFLLTTECRRLPISIYMDGQALMTDCTRSESGLCDNCSRQSSKRSYESEAQLTEKRKRLLADGERAKEIRELRQQEELDLRRLLNVMEKLREKCAACWFLKCEGDETASHRTEMCEKINLEVSEFANPLYKVEYEHGSCCYRCGLPGDLCQDFKQKAAEECRKPNLGLIAVSLGVTFDVAWIVKELQRCSGVQYDRSMRTREEKRLSLWLGQPTRVLNQSSNNLFLVWWNVWQKGV